MPAVNCAVDGCGVRLRALFKQDPADPSTWEYPECDVCFRPACAKHVTEIDGVYVCDRCRREQEATERSAVLIDVGALSPGGEQAHDLHPQEGSGA
jgi:hypothetical protein